MAVTQRIISGWRGALIRCGATHIALIDSLAVLFSIATPVTTCTGLFLEESPIAAHPRNTICCIAVCSALIGCSTPRSSGYLPDYRVLDKSQFLESYYADHSAIASKGYGNVVLTSVSTDSIQDQKGITKSECGQWLHNAVTEGSRDAMPVVVSTGSPGFPALLSVSITEMTPGSAGSRILAGELGSGHAWIQIEGKVIDSQTNVTLASFAERRRSSGLTGLRDIPGDSGPTLVKEMIEDISEDIRRELSVSFKRE